MHKQANVLKPPKRRFDTNGFELVHDVLSVEASTVLAQELFSRRQLGKGKNLIDSDIFREFAFSPHVISLFADVMDGDFLFHHANGLFLAGGESIKEWHHDYDGPPKYSKDFPMVHAMFYPAGLNADNGPLILKPGSHHDQVERSFPRRFGSQHFSEEIQVDVPRTAVLIINSALWHCRRLGQTNGPRPYFNISYYRPGIDRPERNKLFSRHIEFITPANEYFKYLSG